MEDKRPEDRRLFDGEYRLMDLIWENEPVRSMELAGICLKVYLLYNVKEAFRPWIYKK